MADIVIVGAGPQALTLSCLLLQKRPRLQRRLRIVDPSGRWLSRWQRQMDQYEIPWLRSPSPHHPHPNAHALRRFAYRQQRQRQLEGAYCAWAAAPAPSLNQPWGRDGRGSGVSLLPLADRDGLRPACAPPSPAALHQAARQINP